MRRDMRRSMSGSALEAMNLMKWDSLKEYVEKHRTSLLNNDKSNECMCVSVCVCVCMHVCARTCARACVHVSYVTDAPIAGRRGT